MAITNATRLSDFAAGIGTEGAILKIDNANQRVGIGTQLPSQMLEVAGIVTATAFHGDGSNLEGITSAGLGTAIDDTEGSVGAVIYYTDDLLSVNETTTVNPPASASAAYTQYRDVKLETNVDLIIETGDDFIPDVLGLGTDASDSTLSGNGVFDQVYADIIKNKNGLGAPAFANGLTSVGIITASKFIGSGIDLTNLNATQLTSGTIAGARFPATLPAASGANLTSLNGSNISAGIVTSSVLGGGTANATTFLNGHGQFAEAGGGSWEYVKTTTVNDAATCHCTIPTYTGFGTALYAAHKFIIRGLRWADGNDQPVLNMRFSLNNGASADTSANYRGATTQQTFSGNQGNNPLGQTFSGKTAIPIMQGGSSDVGVRSINYMEVLIPAQLNYGHTDKQNMYPTYLFNDSVIYGANGSYWRIDGGGMHMAAYTNHITGLELLDVTTSKNFQHCSIVLYRMKLT